LFMVIWVWISRAGIDIEANRAPMIATIAATVVVPLFLHRLLDRTRADRGAECFVSAAA